LNTATVIAPNVSTRQRQILEQYLVALDCHIEDLRMGKAVKVLEVRDFADILHIHPGHLSNTIQQVLGMSPCDLFENKLVLVAKAMLLSTDLSIGEIARQLTYDPSNFTKFFKHFCGVTPKQFRQQALKN
jgi:AraC family transcriptional regulator of adaptative response / methylphosphotriester-DNA alkyltransferase methyltransferase